MDSRKTTTTTRQRTARDAIRLVCLDFDGTIMTYEELPGCFHPSVIDLLNRLGDRGVEWCTNSGRDLGDQAVILERSVGKGLHHLPCAVLCCESFIYERRDGAYLSCEPWNSRVKEELREFHRLVQDIVNPLLENILQRYKPDPVLVGDHYTAFQVVDVDDQPLRLFSELKEALVAVPCAMISRNGGWISILTEAVGKGNVLGEFARQHGFESHEILAIGDQLNDLHMLDGIAARFVGCPASAVREVTCAVRESGGYVADAEGPLGTAEVIGHFLPGLTES